MAWRTRQLNIRTSVLWHILAIHVSKGAKQPKLDAAMVAWIYCLNSNTRSVERISLCRFLFKGKNTFWRMECPVYERVWQGELGQASSHIVTEIQTIWHSIAICWLVTVCHADLPTLPHQKCSEKLHQDGRTPIQEGGQYLLWTSKMQFLPFFHTGLLWDILPKTKILREREKTS